MTSYQKLKEKYEAREQELIQDILVLIDDEKPMAQMEVKMRWKMKVELEKMIWHGVPRQRKMDGILRHINSTGSTASPSTP